MCMTLPPTSSGSCALVPPRPAQRSRSSCSVSTRHARRPLRRLAQWMLWRGWQSLKQVRVCVMMRTEGRICMGLNFAMIWVRFITLKALKLAYDYDILRWACDQCRVP